MDFCVGVLEACDKLPRSQAGRHVALQLTRAATSSGANYEEACGAESRADFVHRLRVVLKEIRESRFWLALIVRVRWLRECIGVPLLREASELRNIVGKSLVTARRNADKVA